jgi:hypothetical protein
LSSSCGSKYQNQLSSSSPVTGFFLQVPQPDLSKLAIMPHN